MRYFIETIRNKYFTFTGRATRTEFFYFVLFYMLFDGIAYGVSALFDAPILESVLSMIADVATTFIVLPFLAVTVRRLHDINKSGWFAVLGFIPVIGSIILIILTLLKSVDDGNRFENNADDNNACYIGLIRKAFTSHYLTFSGRASRTELWAVYYVFWMALDVASLPIQYGFAGYLIPDGLFYLSYFLIAAILALAIIPLIAVTVRRLHDTAISGWWILIKFVLVIGSIIVWILIKFVPVISSIIVLVFLLSKSPIANSFQGQGKARQGKVRRDDKK